MSEQYHSKWERIDAHTDTAPFDSYLNTVNSLEQVRTLKHRSHQLLSPEAGDTLLDVGCGNGIDVIAMTEDVGSDGTVIGVDNSNGMVQKALHRNPDTSVFSVADAHRLPFDSNSIDGTRAERLFLHANDPQQVFQEFRRVTRPESQVVVCETDWGTIAVDTPADLSDLTSRILDPEWVPVNNARAGRQVRRWALTAGLTDVSVETRTLTLTDFDIANEVFGFETRIDILQDNDALTDEERSKWLDSLQQADEDGVFFSSVIMYIITGTVPS